MWAVFTAIIAGAAALGVYVHHRRFVGYHRFKGLPAPTIGFWRWLAADIRAFTTLAWWHVRGFLRDGLRTPSPTHGRPVLCVHGYTQNATNFHGLRRVLERAGRPTIAVSLWHRLAPIGWYAHRLERRLERLAREFPDGIDIVAHSMGGVVLRMVLAAREDLRGVVHTVITLGSPHRGTAAARGIPLVPELLAMKRRSALLAGLPSLTELVPHGRVVAIAGDADTIVYPVDSSLVPGAEGVVLRGVTHAGLLTSSRAHAAVRHVLREP
jgi:triacylglycerol lipase